MPTDKRADQLTHNEPRSGLERVERVIIALIFVVSEDDALGFGCGVCGGDEVGRLTTH